MCSIYSVFCYQSLFFISLVVVFVASAIGDSHTDGLEAEVVVIVAVVVIVLIAVASTVMATVQRLYVLSLEILLDMCDSY